MLHVTVVKTKTKTIILN